MTNRAIVVNMRTKFLKTSSLESLKAPQIDILRTESGTRKLDNTTETAQDTP